jgi:hypothetical protein
LRTTFAISRERMFESTTNLCPLWDCTKTRDRPSLA